MATAPKLVAQRTFYKRPLPPSCIAFTSKEGKRLFAKALAEDNLESYFLLAVCSLCPFEAELIELTSRYPAATNGPRLSLYAASCLVS